MVTRRDFLKTMSMASAGLALGAGDLLHAQTISPKKGRGDKVKIAYIGIGNRGEQIIEDFARTGMVEVVALCDVDMGAKHTQKIMAKYPKAKQFRDFRQLCDFDARENTLLFAEQAHAAFFRRGDAAERSVVAVADVFADGQFDERIDERFVFGFHIFSVFMGETNRFVRQGRTNV